MKITAWDKLGAYLKETQILGSIQNSLYWDQNTSMPRKGSSWRAEQLTYLAKNLHKRNSSKKFAELIDSANDEIDNLKINEKNKNNKNNYQKKNIELLNKELERQRKLDPKLVELLARAKSKGYESWYKAKMESNFQIFLPHFKKLIELRIEEAKQISMEASPWEILAQPYEPDISKKWLYKMFNPIKEIIPNLLDNIKVKDKKNWDISGSSQKKICADLLDEFGRDNELVAVAESPHPFSITLGPQDFRITTRIVKGEPFSSFLATAHEWGHSIYEQGLPSYSHQWFAWPLGQATSMSVHESQSLFWENRIAKSKSFSKRFFNHFVNQGCPLNSYVDLWKEINIFKAGLNRVEADELSYGIHILIRTELEMALIEGDLDPKDLPYEWNKMYEDLLGIRPSSDGEGCLQDVHWSEGAFGYFPSYLLGHLISAQLAHEMEKDIGLIDDLIDLGKYSEIKNWLKLNVHQYGRSVNAMHLVKEVTKNELSPDYFINYLQAKIAALN